ncbi:uncharacterized protein LOC135937406 [Cloeon dipterum]|uniref:uncharacterized protein LOC135937406 n=1 Tax=Cloeon dipterum TaxID=197152 RepID=UPI00322085B0
MHSVAGLNIYWPFTFALDQNGTLWITEVDFLKRPRYRLLKVAVGAKSYIFDSTPERCSLSVPEEQESIILTEELDQCRMFNIILICSNVFTVILSSLIIHWLHLRQKRKKSLSKITNEAQQMSVLRENQEVQNENSRIVAATSVLTGYDDEGLYDEVIYHRPPCTPPPVDPYEKPICHSPCCVKKVKSMPVRPRTFEEFGEAPHAPVEYDDVGPAEPEEQDDYVAPAPPITPHCEETTSESAQYLKILS